MIHANLYNLTENDKFLSLSTKSTKQIKIEQFDNFIINNNFNNNFNNNNILSIFNSDENKASSDDDKNIDRIYYINMKKYFIDGDKNGSYPNNSTSSNLINNNTNYLSNIKILNIQIVKKGNKRLNFLNINDNIKSKGNKEIIFKITKKIKDNNLFSNVDNNNDDYKNQIDEGTKRFPKKRNRFKNTDNIRKKILTAFINNYTLDAINKQLKIKGSQNYFEKFPAYFINKKNSKMLMNMTIKEFILKKELYIKTGKLINYHHNINVINSVELSNNSDLKKIFDITLKNLFKAYINSDEFKLDEINRLRKKNMNDWYIKRYIKISKVIEKI